MTTTKKSNTLDWILRILFFFIALISVGLIMLNMVSGTGEPQHRGLEQAFSDSLGVPISIGTLNKFNAFPQFIIDVSNLETKTNEQNKIIKAQKILIAFSLFDLLRNKKTIQKFEIEAGEFFYPDFNPKHFTNVSTKIIPPTIQNDQAQFSASATIEKKPFNISIPLQHKKSGIEFNYSMIYPVQMKINYGSCEVTGEIEMGNALKWHLPTKLHADCAELLSLFKR